MVLQKIHLRICKSKELQGKKEVTLRLEKYCNFTQKTLRMMGFVTDLEDDLETNHHHTARGKRVPHLIFEKMLRKVLPSTFVTSVLNLVV